MAFLIPTEIYPSELRAQGNGFGITGWAIGVGMTTLVNPIMFGTLTVGLSTFIHALLINAKSSFRVGPTSFLPA